MPRSTVAPEVRAAALADLLAGEQPAIVAERYGLDRSVVKMWKQRHVTADVTKTDIPAVTTTARPALDRAQLTIAELVMDNLKAKLRATQAIADHVSTNDNWRDKQTAAELGDLFEHLDRSAVAILDRMAGRADRDRADD